MPSSPPAVVPGVPALEQFSREAGAFTDPSGLRDFLVRSFQGSAGCSAVALYSSVRASGRFSPCAARGVDLNTLPSFDVQGRLLHWLRVNEEPFVRGRHAGALRHLDETERAALLAVDMQLSVPLMASHRLVAFCLFMGPIGPWSQDSDLIEFLAACGVRAAMALERTEQRQLEREHLHASARAHQLAVTGQVAAAVAHEVRNPLAVIRSSVQFLMDPSIEDDSRRQLSQGMMGEIDRINQAITGVLGLSRPQPIALKPVRLDTVIADALDQLQPYVAHQRLSLSRQLPAEQPLVLGDAAQLRQILLNVLLNACEATPSGGSLSVFLDLDRELPGQPVPPAGARAVLRIVDTGRGIPRDVLPHVFDQYFTTKTSGTGLGLSICRQIIEQHGGSIELLSEMGLGTTVLISLPLHRQ